MKEPGTGLTLLPSAPSAFSSSCNKVLQPTHSLPSSEGFLMGSTGQGELCCIEFRSTPTQDFINTCL